MTITNVPDGLTNETDLFSGPGEFVLTDGECPRCSWPLDENDDKNGDGFATCLCGASVDLEAKDPQLNAIPPRAEFVLTNGECPRCSWPLDENDDKNGDGFATCLCGASVDLEAKDPQLNVLQDGESPNPLAEFSTEALLAELKRRDSQQS